MGGANYLKMSQHYYHKRVKDSVYDSNRKATLFGEGHQVGRSHTFAIVAMIKLRILAATIQVGYSYISPGVGHFVYHRKRDKREVKRDIALKRKRDG